MSRTWLTISSPRPRPQSRARISAEVVAGAFEPRRHQARRDDRGLQQPEIVFREIKDLPQRGNVGRGPEIHADQPEHGLVDDAQVSGDRRPGVGIAAVDTEVDRNVEDLGSLGKIHAKEENVGPRGVAEVHAHGGLFAQDGIRRVRAGALQQLTAQVQRIVERVAGAEHPLVAAHLPDGFLHLLRQGFEGKTVVGRRQGAAQGIGRAMRVAVGEIDGDGFLEPPGERELVAFVGNEPEAVGGEMRRQEITVDGLKEKNGPHAVVEIRGRLAVVFERLSHVLPGPPCRPRGKDVRNGCHRGRCLRREIGDGRPWRRACRLAAGGVDRHLLGEHGQQFGAGRAGQTERKLRAQHAEMGLEVGAAAGQLGGQVFFPRREPGQCRRQPELGVRRAVPPRRQAARICAGVSTCMPKKHR